MALRGKELIDFLVAHDKELKEALAQSLDVSDLAENLPEDLQWQFDGIHFGNTPLGVIEIEGGLDDGNDDTGVTITLGIIKIEQAGDALRYTGREAL